IASIRALGFIGHLACRSTDNGGGYYRHRVGARNGRSCEIKTINRKNSWHRKLLVLRNEIESNSAWHCASDSITNTVVRGSEEDQQCLPSRLSAAWLRPCWLARHWSLPFRPQHKPGPIVRLLWSSRTHRADQPTSWRASLRPGLVQLLVSLFWWKTWPA